MTAKPLRVVCSRPLRDRLKHVRQVARIVSCIGQNSCTENVSLRFVFAAVLCHPCCRSHGTRLSPGLTAHDSTAQDKPELSEHASSTTLLRRLCRRMAESNVADLVRHHACHLALIPRRFDHPAVYIHRPAGQCKSIDITGVNNLELVIEFRLTKLRRHAGHEPVADRLHIARQLFILKDRKLLLDLYSRFTPQPYVITNAVFVFWKRNCGLCHRHERRYCQTQYKCGRNERFPEASRSHDSSWACLTYFIANSGR